MAGVLTGQCFKSMDTNIRLLEDWGQFYPLDKAAMSSDGNVVEVVVGGVKMRYPSCYVLVTDMDDTANSSVTGINASANANGLVKNESSEYIFQCSSYYSRVSIVTLTVPWLV